MPSCSNTSRDHYNLHQSCVPDLYRTTDISGGWGELPLSQKKSVI